MALTDKFEGLGPNSGLVEEMYRQFLENPSSVSASWREFFADYSPRGAGPATGPVPIVKVPAPAQAAPAMPATTPAAPAAPADGKAKPAAGAPLILDGETAEPLRGAAARVVDNMESSLGVPTATSVRTVAAKLLEVNRQILNNHLNRVGRGKVSFTHLIAYAIAKAVQRMPAMNSGFGVVDGKPMVVHHEHLNLGLAVDVERPDGSRSLIVPNIKH